MKYKVRGYVVGPSVGVLMITVLSARRRSDLVIYALLEGQEGVWVGGEKKITKKKVSVDTEKSNRYLLRVSVGVSCLQSPSP